MKDNSRLINQDSGITEYYTPAYIVEMAREVMGSIDLDPASCEEANKTVKANYYFTKDHDGLNINWYGYIWMNHPFSRKGNPIWINKLISEYESGNIRKACCITFSNTGSSWFQSLMQYPQCFIAKRINYEYPGGKDGLLKKQIDEFFSKLQFSMSSHQKNAVFEEVKNKFNGDFSKYLKDNDYPIMKELKITRGYCCTKDSVVTYLGDNTEKFKEVFGKIGIVK